MRPWGKMKGGVLFEQRAGEVIDHSTAHGTAPRVPGQ